MTPAQFALLLALSQEERHGWGLIKDVEELTGGRIVLGPGTLYRTLQRLRVDGLIEEIGADVEAVRADRRAERQRRYKITKAGRAAVRDEARFLAELVDQPPVRRLLGRK